MYEYMLEGSSLPRWHNKNSPAGKANRRTEFLRATLCETRAPLLLHTMEGMGIMSYFGVVERVVERKSGSQVVAIDYHITYVSSPVRSTGGGWWSTVGSQAPGWPRASARRQHRGGGQARSFPPRAGWTASATVVYIQQETAHKTHSLKKSETSEFSLN